MPRPRSIPEEEAVERALLLFWRKGYERASIADLSEAIGVGPSSIYNAFGSKAALFQRALEHYMATRAHFVGESVARSTEAGAEVAVRELLHAAVQVYRSKRWPRGCALLQGGGAGTPEDAEGSAITLELKRELEATLRELFEAARTRGDELSASPKVLAKYVLATMRGLSQLASDGASLRELKAVADVAVSSTVCPPRE